MTTTARRLAEIYSYYINERYLDDLSQTFTEWLTTSMYGDELTKLAASELDIARREVELALVWTPAVGQRVSIKRNVNVHPDFHNYIGKITEINPRGWLRVYAHNRADWFLPGDVLPFGETEGAK